MAFLGIGKRKKTHLPPLDMIKVPMPNTSAEELKLPDLPSLPDLPPLPDLNLSTQDLAPSMQLGSPEKPLEELELPELKSTELPPMPDLPPLPELPPMPEDQKPRKLKLIKKMPKFEKLPPLDKRKYQFPGIKPLFVESNDYKSILTGINTVKRRIKEAEVIFDNLQILKKDQEKLFKTWQNELEDIQRKLVYVDKTIFEA